jgi:hypothetical protein
LVRKRLLPLTGNGEGMASCVHADDAVEPRRMPGWLVGALAGPVAVYYGTSLRGASSVRARAELGWSARPWRAGFAAEFTGP